MNVAIQPLPAKYRGKKFRPMPPPIFPDGEPTPEDVALALALLDELDPESQAWYGHTAFVARLDPERDDQ